jgi:hypothetical protein
LLIEHKLQAERVELESIPLVDLSHLIRVAEAQKEGLQPVILHRHSGDTTVVVTQKSSAVAMLPPATDQPKDVADTVVPDTPSIPALRRPTLGIEESVPAAKCPVVDPEVPPVNPTDKLEKKPKKKRRPKVIVLEDIPIN